MKTLVIGGGIIGLSSAFELALRGANVTVLERGACGAESSWAGGGILSPLMPWAYSSAVTDLTQFSCRLFSAWAARIAELSGVDPEYRVSGLELKPPCDAELAARWCVEHDVRLEQDGESLWLPEVAQVRNPRLIKALRLALEKLGVRIVEHAEVTEITSSEGRVDSLETTVGAFSADAYVVTAGAWSKTLLAESGLALEIKPVRGQMLLYKALPGILRHIILQNGTYLIPREDGHILVGSTLEDVGFDKSTTNEAKSLLSQRAVDILPEIAQAKLVMHWAGLRPGSPDNIPIIDRHPQLQNLYLNSGHFRYGVTMAPASAAILVNRIFGLEQPIEVTTYNWPTKLRALL